jgi:EmrB/QacA subfamily drug resistance transporter
MPCTLSILTNVFVGERDRARAIGFWSGTAGLGVAIGPILGGFLLVHYWWGSVFLINVPIAALGLVATAFLIPNSKNPSIEKADPVGALLSIFGFGLLLWAIIEAPGHSWTSPLVLGAFVGSAVIITAFVVWERHSDHPMLPLKFFRRRRYSVAIASLALLLFALLGMFFLMTQYLQFCLGFSPLQTGLAIGPLAAVLLVTAPLSVIASRRWGTKVVVASGLVLVAVALGLLSGTTVHDRYIDLLPSFLLLGIGFGFAMAPTTESIMGSLPMEEAGVGSATSDTSMQMGGALGVAVLGTALTVRYQDVMRPLLAHQPVPASVSDVILGSLGGALAVAQHVPGKLGTALAQAAKHGFVSGMNLALIIAAVIVGIAAVVVFALLPNRGETVSTSPRHGREGPKDSSVEAAGT